MPLPRIFGLFEVFGGAGREIERDDENCYVRWPSITDDVAIRHARRCARRGDRKAIEAVAIHQHEKRDVRLARAEFNRRED